jgi:hypothetical protein
MSALNAQRLVAMHLHVPPSGGWLADVTIESGGVPALGPATLTFGDTRLVGTIIRAGLDAPDQPRATVAGGAGWRNVLPSPGASYVNPGGVRLLTVMRDLATIAGELYDAPADAFLGPAYQWDAGRPGASLRCRMVLADLVQRGALPTWRVAPTGRTRFDAWPALGASDAHGRIVHRDADRGMRVVALDTVTSAFLPGATLEGAKIARVTFVEKDSELRAKVSES